MKRTLTATVPVRLFQPAGRWNPRSRVYVEIMQQTLAVLEGEGARWRVVWTAAEREIENGPVAALPESAAAAALARMGYPVRLLEEQDGDGEEEGAA